MNGVLWNRQIRKINKLQIYNSILKGTVTYGAETSKFNKHLESKPVSVEIDCFKKNCEMFKIRKKKFNVDRKSVV